METQSTSEASVQFAEAVQPTHSFVIRIIVPAEDNDVVFEDSDFAEDARFDWFSEVLRETAEPGELVQLIDLAAGRTVHQETKGNS